MQYADALRMAAGRRDCRTQRNDRQTDRVMPSFNRKTRVGCESPSSNGSSIAAEWYGLQRYCAIRRWSPLSAQVQQRPVSLCRALALVEWIEVTAIISMISTARPACAIELANASAIRHLCLNGDAGSAAAIPSGVLRRCLNAEHATAIVHDDDLSASPTSPALPHIHNVQEEPPSPVTPPGAAAGVWRREVAHCRYLQVVLVTAFDPVLASSTIYARELSG